jgi:GDP-mannose 6-dehydrogenase
MRIAVFGLGYVGLTSAVCLSGQGHDVLGVDINGDKIRDIMSGRAPFFEPGVDEGLRRALKEGRLTCTIAPDWDMMSRCDLAFVCVGTPGGPDGSHNMAFVANVTRQIAEAVDPKRSVPLPVVYRSTFRPGTMEGLVAPIFAAVLGDWQTAVEPVYNPEFLRESVAMADFLNPPKIVVGTRDGTPCRLLDELNDSATARVFYTHYREAEFTKFVDNTFHATKITFANEIGRTCLNLGIDPKVVHDIFVSDTKLNISADYLRPGGPFGGSCLPKDIRALQHIGADVGAGLHMVDALLRSNEAHKHFLFEHCTHGLARRANILMLGLAFKRDSDDLRESPYVDLARKLLQAEFKVSVYDPTLDPRKLIGQNLGYAFMHLPTFGSLLVDRTTVETQRYDLVIDTNGTADTVPLRQAPIKDVSRL